MKRKIYLLLNHNRYVIEFIYTLIVVNVFVLILESFEEISVPYGHWLHLFDLISIIIFTIEYVLRLWTSDCNEHLQGNSLRKRFKFATSFYGVVDLLAFLPFYIPYFVVMDLRILRILRLFRLLRIFKLGRVSRSMRMIAQVLKETRTELFVTLFSCTVLIIFSSTLMYYIENDAQPEKFQNIGNSVWWAVATLTTVGYGDIYPITPIGKLLGAITAIIGIGFVALPSGIISSAFISHINMKSKFKHSICTCPKCGNEFKV